MKSKHILLNVVLFIFCFFGFSVKVSAQVENVTNLTAVTEKYIAVLSWTPSPATDYYWILRNGVKLDIQVTGSASSQTVSNLEPSTDYTFTLISWSGGVQSTGVSVECRTKDLQTEIFQKGENIALGKPCVASTSWQPASFAVDNDSTNTRWESESSDPQWFYVDLLQPDTIKNISIIWEAAYAKAYTIDVSNDANNWTTMYSTTKGNGGIDEIYIDTIARYVRFSGTERATGYGYSFFEFQIFKKAPEAKLTSILIEPSNVSVELGNSQTFTCAGRDQYGKNFPLQPTWSVSGGGTINEQGVFTATQIGSPFFVKVTDASGIIGSTEISVKPKIEFSLLEPAANDMVTDTRKPTFQWQAFNGAVKYEVYLNITRTDYDWMAPGNLLDRYTKVGETTQSEFTLTQDLNDRWTYKWYVVATDEQGDLHYSETKVFSLYLPKLETVDDGVQIINGSRDLNKNGTIEPYENWKNPIEIRINDLMSRMTIEEKAYQMFYNAQQFNLAGWAFGPINETESQTLQAAAAGSRLGIPYVTSGDCIHGYKTTYPVQSAMAATRDLDLVYRCGEIQRMEQVAVGFRGTLAPLAEVGTKVLYPRIQEGAGEDADFAAGMTRALVTALQGGPELNPKSVMVHTKHWPGEGAGGEGLIVYDGVTINYHMKPWYANKEANAGGVMPGYAGSSFIDPGGPGAGDSPAILRYLREVIGYDGIICTDWLPWGSWVNAASAGADVMGGADPGAVGFNMNDFISQVGEERIDDAVRRILRVKFQLGIFEDPYGDPIGGQANFHTPQSHATVVEAARRSMTLLKNNNVLPVQVILNEGDELLVTGPRANDQAAYSIWTSYFHVDNGAKTFFQGVKERAEKENINVVNTATDNTKLAIVCVGESGYTHRTSWDAEKPYLHDALFEDGRQDIDISLLKEIKERGIPIVVVYIMPRPYVLGWSNDNCDAVVMAYRPGDGAGEGLASILFGDYLPEGKLPWQLPRSIEQVGGDTPETAAEQWDLPYDLGASNEEREIIRNLIAAGEPVPPIYGNPLYQYGYGMDNFGLIDNTAPNAFQLLTPTNNFNTNTPPLLSWEASTDDETNIKHYEIWLDDQLIVKTKQNTYQLAFVKGNGTHQWYVVAENWAGKRTKSTNTLSFNITDTTQPSAFSLLSPANGATVEGDLLLVWGQSVDEGTGIETYDVYINNVKVKELAPTTSSQTENLALNSTVYASSNNGAMTADLAADEKLDTRWQALTNVNEWIMFDLNDFYLVNQLILNWEVAYGKVYDIQTSLDGTTWNTVYSETNSNGGEDIIQGINAPCRYVRINCTTGGTDYAFSLWDVAISGTPAVSVNIGAWPNGTYTWTVKATDYAGNEKEANTPFSFTMTNVAENIAPTANAGDAKTLILPINSTVLDATASFDPENVSLTYLWEKTSGPSATIQNPTSAITNVFNLTEGTYTFKLTVSDGEKTGIDYVDVTVHNPTKSETNIEEKQDISVFYTTNTLYIQGTSDIQDYQLFDMYGRMIQSGNTNVITVDLSPGVYMLKIKSGIFKFVVY